VEQVEREKAQEIVGIEAWKGHNLLIISL
jgi:hypothetical protein